MPTSRRLEEDFTLGGLGFKKVKLLPDGAAVFTRGMGMSCLWDTERGFGERSWRHAMVVSNGTIEKLWNFLPDGRVEIGVHVADVSHFVQPGAAVDNEVM